MCVKTDFLNQWLLKLNNNNAQKEYYLTDIIELAVNDHVDIADVISSNENTIQGVNSMKELIDLERSYMKEKAQLLIDQGIKIIDPERIDIRGSLMCEEGVVIDIGCIFEGDVILKKGTYIGPYNIIKDTTIGQSNQLLAFNHIDQAIIGNGCNIGPYARIRPATSLSNNINIGNFVELKKSTVGNHTKINHLSYVGDSSIGESVNLGAGTITCNYDGANKHQTIIEDDVFIGSDTQLIAPVIIKKGATIGAGSTIVEDAPENQLTLSRVSQKSISNWQRPKKK
jgi:bifunctional UDP-N-acetylglucosamine pyrophosphorylase/glucosamine-1-phosphate N-acetyltransferase